MSRQFEHEDTTGGVPMGDRAGEPVLSVRQMFAGIPDDGDVVNTRALCERYAIVDGESSNGQPLRHKQR